MKPRKPPPEQDDLLRARLIEMIDMRHELVKLAALIDWEVFEREWAGLFPSPAGRPATPTRVVAGLFYLQHAFRLSDCVFHGRWAPIPADHGERFHASGSLADWFMESGSTRRVKRFHCGGALAQAFSGEGQSVSIMDEPVVRARPRYAPTVPFPSPSETAIALSLIPCAYFNRSTSRIRRIDSRPVGISASSLKTKVTVASDCRPNPPTIAWNACPSSRGNAAHDQLEWAPIIPWNTQSDEAVVGRWAENPYWQHFCGETFFQHRLPIDPSSMTRWRNRIGEEGVEWLLTETIRAGQRAGTVQDDQLKKVTVDTTVMEKNIAHPTDARLYEVARRKLVGLARAADINLRQTYNRLGPWLCGQVGRYAHARQFKRMRKALRRLKGYTGRVLRDIERQMGKVLEGPLKTRLQDLVALVNRLLAQKTKDRRKLYEGRVLSRLRPATPSSRYRSCQRQTVGFDTQGDMRPLLGIPDEISVLDILLFGPPAAKPYKRWRRPIEQIVHRDRYDRSHFMSDAELEDWIRNRRHKVMYKDAQNVD